MSEEVSSRRLEARAYVLHLDFDGAPAVLRVRVFIDGPNVVAVRSVQLRAPDGRKLPDFNDGVIKIAEPSGELLPAWTPEGSLK